MDSTTLTFLPTKKFAMGTTISFILMSIGSLILVAELFPFFIPISTVLIFLGLCFAVANVPELLLCVLILLITNILGLFNVVETYRIPGVGKPSDFLLIFISLATFVIWFGRRKSISSEEMRLVVFTILLVLYFLWLVFYTSEIANRNSFNYALRVGAPYLYYIAYLFPIFLVTREKQFLRFFSFIRLAGIASALISLLSNLLGHSITSAAQSGEYLGFVRVYLLNHFSVTVILYGLITKLQKDTKVEISYIEILINFLGLLLFLGRTALISLFLMILIVVLYLRGFGLSKKFALISIGVFGTYMLVSIFGFGIGTIFQRFEEGLQDISGMTPGTLQTRLNLVAYGFTTFKEMPLLGTGFVRGDAPFYLSRLLSAEGYAMTNSSDAGLASILFTTGIIGFSLVVTFLIMNLKLIKRRLDIRRLNKNYDMVFNFALAVFASEIVRFFIEQISSNVYGDRYVAIDVMLLSFSVKLLVSKEPLK